MTEHVRKQWYALFGGEWNEGAPVPPICLTQEEILAIVKYGQSALMLSRKTRAFDGIKPNQMFWVKEAYRFFDVTESHITFYDDDHCGFDGETFDHHGMDRYEADGQLRNSYADSSYGETEWGTRCWQREWDKCETWAKRKREGKEVEDDYEYDDEPSVLDVQPSVAMPFGLSRITVVSAKGVKHVRKKGLSYLPVWVKEVEGERVWRPEARPWGSYYGAYYAKTAAARKKGRVCATCAHCDTKRHPKNPYDMTYSCQHPAGVQDVRFEAPKWICDEYKPEETTTVPI